MKKLLLTVAIFFSSSSALSASYLIDIYYARISERDHYSSSGLYLRDISAILRQDRANYHKFYKRDREDTSDSFFSSKRNRGKLRYLLRYGYISERTEEAILYRNPLLKIRIYNDHIVVKHIR